MLDFSLQARENEPPVTSGSIQKKQITALRGRMGMTEKDVIWRLKAEREQYAVQNGSERQT